MWKTANEYKRFVSGLEEAARRIDPAVKLVPAGTTVPASGDIAAIDDAYRRLRALELPNDLLRSLDVAYERLQIRTGRAASRRVHRSGMRLGVNHRASARRDAGSAEVQR